MNVPPSTGRLAQQLSVLAPQSESPGPSCTQLGDAPGRALSMGGAKIGPTPASSPGPIAEGGPDGSSSVEASSLESTAARPPQATLRARANAAAVAPVALLLRPTHRSTCALYYALEKHVSQAQQPALASEKCQSDGEQ